MWDRQRNPLGLTERIPVETLGVGTLPVLRNPGSWSRGELFRDLGIHPGGIGTRLFSATADNQSETMHACQVGSDRGSRHAIEHANTFPIHCRPFDIERIS